MGVDPGPGCNGTVTIHSPVIRQLIRLLHALLRTGYATCNCPPSLGVRTLDGENEGCIDDASLLGEEDGKEDEGKRVQRVQIYRLLPSYALALLPFVVQILITVFLWYKIHAFF